MERTRQPYFGNPEGGPSCITEFVADRGLKRRHSDQNLKTNNLNQRLVEETKLRNCKSLVKLAHTTSVEKETAHTPQLTETAEHQQAVFRLTRRNCNPKLSLRRARTRRLRQKGIHASANDENINLLERFGNLAVSNSTDVHRPKEHRETTSAKNLRARAQISQWRERREVRQNVVNSRRFGVNLLQESDDSDVDQWPSCASLGKLADMFAAMCLEDQRKADKITPQSPRKRKAKTPDDDIPLAPKRACTRSRVFNMNWNLLRLPKMMM